MSLRLTSSNRSLRCRSGASRDFQLKERSEPKRKVSLSLGDGDLLVMHPVASRDGSTRAGATAVAQRSDQPDLPMFSGALTQCGAVRIQPQIGVVMAAISVVRSTSLAAMAWLWRTASAIKRMEIAVGAAACRVSA